VRTDGRRADWARMSSRWRPRGGVLVTAARRGPLQRSRKGPGNGAPRTVYPRCA
jgi:hypothetical protein